jgi:pyruvate dehydrogenase E1 component alpha subunit
LFFRSNCRTPKPSASFRSKVLKGMDRNKPTPELMREIYWTMLRIRHVEQRVAKLVEKGEIRCPCHLCIGQEAVAAGVCVNLRPDDYLFGAHRSHGHYLAKRGDLKKMMAELFGKVTGCARGRGGSMHLVAPEVGILGTVPIVAATIPMAVGTALSSKLRRDYRVSVSFFGDGAVDEGTFHESMNLAASRILPVVFVCENNLYAMGTRQSRIMAIEDISKRASGYGLEGVSVDGNDVLEVHSVVDHAVIRARMGNGPALIECKTYRLKGHSRFDAATYRPKEEVEEWIKRDAIKRMRDRLLEEKIAKEEELKRIEDEVRQKVEEAAKFAKESPQPDPATVTEDVYAD